MGFFRGELQQSGGRPAVFCSRRPAHTAGQSSGQQLGSGVREMPWEKWQTSRARPEFGVKTTENGSLVSVRRAPHSELLVLFLFSLSSTTLSQHRSHCNSCDASGVFFQPNQELQFGAPCWSFMNSSSLGAGHCFHNSFSKSHFAVVLSVPMTCYFKCHKFQYKVKKKRVWGLKMFAIKSSLECCFSIMFFCPQTFGMHWYFTVFYFVFVLVPSPVWSGRTGAPSVSQTWSPNISVGAQRCSCAWMGVNPCSRWKADTVECT